MSSSFLASYARQTGYRPQPGEGELPFEDRPPLVLLNLTLGNGRIQRFRQPFDSGYQRFNRLTTRHCLLE